MLGLKKMAKQNINIAKVIELYEQGKTQTEIALIFNTTQKVIWSRLKEINYICRIPKNTHQNGEKNKLWKGNKAGYAALHYRVTKARGKPNKCEICGNIYAKSFEWANLNGNFEDINDYKRMCGSCHAKFDNKIKNINGVNAK